MTARKACGVSVSLIPTCYVILHSPCLQRSYYFYNPATGRVAVALALDICIPHRMDFIRFLNMLAFHSALSAGLFHLANNFLYDQISENNHNTPTSLSGTLC